MKTTLVGKTFGELITEQYIYRAKTSEVKWEQSAFTHFWPNQHSKYFTNMLLMEYGLSHPPPTPTPTVRMITPPPSTKCLDNDYNVLLFALLESYEAENPDQTSVKLLLQNDWGRIGSVLFHSDRNVAAWKLRSRPAYGGGPDRGW